jgi:hypothetical protein
VTLPYHGSPASNRSARGQHKDLQRLRNGDTAVVGSTAQRSAPALPTEYPGAPQRLIIGTRASTTSDGAASFGNAAGDFAAVSASLAALLCESMRREPLGQDRVVLIVDEPSWRSRLTPFRRRPARPGSSAQARADAATSRRATCIATESPARRATASAERLAARSLIPRGSVGGHRCARRSRLIERWPRRSARCAERARGTSPAAIVAFANEPKWWADSACARPVALVVAGYPPVLSQPPGRTGSQSAMVGTSP